VGDVFRAIDIGSTDGKQVYDSISRGELVADELTMKIWKKAVDAYVALSWYKPREDLLVLDGMPRNVEQVEVVKEYLEIYRIIYLECSDMEDMVHRIRRRAIRENRTDDANEDIIRHRFELYEKVTAPVLEKYDPSIIERIDCNRSPAEVLRAILNATIPVQNEHFRENQ
jgi:adenylate kinase